MKKFLSVILVITLVFSTVLITACNQDNNEEANVGEQSSSTIEENSTGRKPGEGATSTGGGTISSTGSGNTSTGGGDTSTGGGNTSTGGNVGDDTQDPTPPTPVDPNAAYSEYPYKYTNTAVMPSDTTSKVGQLDMFIYLFTEDYAKPSLNGTFYDALVSYETMLNGLSDIEKASLQNKAVLEEARAAYNDMAKQEAEMLINNLPDATINNLTDFGARAKLIENLINNMGLAASNISNKTVYDQKVNEADYLLIDTFNAQVAELATFEYNNEYKAKLDYADEIYSLMNASQQSRVSQSKQALESKKTLYQNTGIVKAFEEKIFALPDTDNLDDSHKSTVLELKTAYGELTAEQQKLLSSEAQAKFDALEKWFAGGRIAYIFDEEYKKTGEASWVKQGWIAKNTPSDFIISGSSLSFSSSGCDVNLIFEGVNYKDKGYNKMKDFTITVTIKSPTVFVMCCNLKSAQKTGDLTVKRDGTLIPEYSMPLRYSEDGTDCEYKFSFDQAGTYVVSVMNCNDSVRVVALALY